MSARKDYELLIHGGGDVEAMRGLLAINPQVRYGGPYKPEQLPGLLQSPDVGLSPSRFETFHRVTREYLKAGLPVLGSTAFGIPDIVRQERNGLLFDVGDACAFRQAVLRILDDRTLLARLSAGARETPVRSTEDELLDLCREYEGIRRERASGSVETAPRARRLAPWRQGALRARRAGAAGHVLGCQTPRPAVNSLHRD